MKRLICLMLALALALPALAGAEEILDLPAAELELGWKAGSKAVDPALLRDGSDATFHQTARSKTAELTAELAEGEQVGAVYVRYDCLPQKVELQFLNSKKKWETAATSLTPGTECLLEPKKAVSGKLRLLTTFEESVSCVITELRAFAPGPTPASLHRWEQPARADVLVIADSAAALETSLLESWTAQGRSVAMALLSAPGSGVAALYDQLWNAGLRIAPLCAGFAEPAADAAATLKKWTEKKTQAAMTGWLRQTQPVLLVTAGEAAARMAPASCASASDVTYNLDSAAADGLWLVEQTVAADEQTAQIIATLGQRDTEALRKICAQPFADAQHSDPALIPYPDNRDAQGYLPEGEFVYEDPEQGLWAYLSNTVQVEIIQYDTQSPKHRWFAAEVKFKPEEEQFKRQLYVNASFKDQQIYPQTLAQTAKMVIAVNGDYYLARADKKSAVGNILRDGQVLYNVSKTSAWPNLDTMALHDDGSISVYDAKEITADELAAMGGVHDALSFGPYLVKDGRLRIYHEKNANAAEPRCAMGMIEPGHYVIIDCEGRVPDGTKGLTVNETGMLLYSYGVTEAFNLDGGSTSVLIFMGEKLNRTGKDTSIGSPRNQHELFGVGTSELVHTDWVKGKPKK